jgi:hypothetical protein
MTHNTIGDAAQILGGYGDVLMPGDLVAPILSPAQRAAIQDWLAEINAKDELAAHGLEPRVKGLFFGPPGTGKTTLGHTLAAALKMPLVSVKAETLQSKWVNASAENIGQFFDAVKKMKGKVAILFDEFDSLAPNRGASSGQSADRESAKSVNALLRRLEQHKSLTFATTNRKDAIDPAIWRRFDIHIEIGLPGEDERYSIIRMYSPGMAIPEEDMDVLVKMTFGASPALLKSLMQGIARNRIIWPKVSKDPSDAHAMLAAVAAACAPPPGLTTPPLWEDTDVVAKQLQWQWATIARPALPGPGAPKQ